MKLRDYLPELPSFVQQSERLGELTHALGLMKSIEEGGEVYKSPSLGLNQLVSQWLRQQMAYRFQMVVDLMTIALTVAEIRAPIHHITSEVFRKGITWKQKFAVKCQKCKAEYEELYQECPECRTGEFLTKPDEHQKKRLNEFLDDSNIYDQSLEEILREFHFDLNVVDDAFIYIAKEYIGEGRKVRSRVTEIRRIHPALIEFDLDAKGLPKNSHFFCYIHRELEASREPGKCSKCARNLVPAMYVYWNRGPMDRMYLMDSEIIHLSKFSPSATYGWSPVMTIFERALTLIGMDKNLYRYFFDRTMPASMVMVFTDDPENLRRERANLAAQVKLNPNYVPLVAVSAKQNRGRVDMIRLFHTMQEMDYLPIRNEIRERIGAMWGVTPAWQGAPEAFGGLSTQTTQLMVMSRVIEGDQRLFHHKVFPHILDAFGVTDWVLELPQPEEKAEATKMALMQQRISAASALFQMGFDIKPKASSAGISDIDFIVSGEPKKPDMGGMFGGSPVSSMDKATSWIQQIVDAGYSSPTVKEVSPTGDKIWFQSGDSDWIAYLSNGTLERVEKATFRHDIGEAPVSREVTPKPGGEDSNEFEDDYQNPELPQI